MGLGDRKNLNEIGYKEVTVRGEEFLIFWNKRNNHNSGRSTSGYYEGFASYAYQENGKIKSASFVSEDIDKETAWGNLINDIDTFLKQIKSKD